jgi:hypothetical protein
MPLGSLLLFSIGKSGAILTIYMALHQAVKTKGKNIESRPPFPCQTRKGPRTRFAKGRVFGLGKLDQAQPGHKWELENNREITPMVSQMASSKGLR